VWSYLDIGVHFILGGNGRIDNNRENQILMTTRADDGVLN